MIMKGEKVKVIEMVMDLRGLGRNHKDSMRKPVTLLNNILGLYCYMNLLCTCRGDGGAKPWWGPGIHFFTRVFVRDERKEKH
jgi:hypothetical protein